MAHAAIRNVVEPNENACCTAAYGCSAMREGGAAIRKRAQPDCVHTARQPACIDAVGQRLLRLQVFGHAVAHARARCAPWRGAAAARGRRQSPACDQRCSFSSSTSRWNCIARCGPMAKAWCRQAAAAGQQRRARRQSEGLLVPLEHRPERPVAEPMPCVASLSCSVNRMPADLGRQRRANARAQRTGHQLPAQAMADDRAAARHGVEDQQFGAAQRRQRIVGTHLAAQDRQRREVGHVLGIGLAGIGVAQFEWHSPRGAARWPGRPGRRC